MTTPSAPPTSEKGYEVANPTAPGGPGTPSWAFFGGGILDQTEDVPLLQWPNNIKVYDKMRIDAQIDALIKSVVLPLRRLNYMIKPNGARDEVVEDISTQLSLPIYGSTDEFILRGRKRFSHDEHLRLALLAPTVYGHMPFEQVGNPIADDLKWRLKRLAPRMPRTISKFDIARDGGLNAIVQYDPRSMKGLPIPITQLIMYCWEKEGGNWSGRSMLRPLYKYWLLKDRMLRIDAIKNERFGAGIPTGTAPQGGDPADYQKLAGAIRASENGGVGLPAGASIGVEGLRGSLPDTLASIRMYDEQMARSWLLMLLQLGQTETGSRALGQTFKDFFTDALWGFAGWYCSTTNEHLIEDIVDWNYGEDEQAPLLVAVEPQDSPLDASELASLVQSGALTVDAEVEGWIRGQYGMPADIGEPVNQPPVPVTSSAERRERRKAAARARHESHPKASSQTVNTDRVGHRDPNAVEVRAGIDFDAIQKAWEDATKSLVEKWADVRADQIDAIVASIEQAVKDGDMSLLTRPDCPVLGEDVLIQHMTDASAAAMGEALKEAASQGVELSEVAVSDLEDAIAHRANATANLLANGLSDSAGRNAVLWYTPGSEPAEVSAEVRSALESLSDSYLNDQLGGALTMAQNAGRIAVMGQASPTVYASELLDENTCEFCAEVDGTEYPNLDDATYDYPTGGYADCAGGPRCRGTLVAVYGEGE